MFSLSFSVSNPRYLNEKQKALILAYAELEDDVNGTVSGIGKSDKGELVGLLSKVRFLKSGRVFLEQKSACLSFSVFLFFFPLFCVC